MPAIQCSRSTASMAFGGALPETIPVISANSVSRNTFARATAAAAHVGYIFALLVSARRTDNNYHAASDHYDRSNHGRPRGTKSAYRLPGHRGRRVALLVRTID